MSMRPTRATRRASEVLVRPAREEEYAAVGALTVAGYDADGHLTLPDESADTSYADWLADAAARAADGAILVAVEGRTLLGTVTWCPYGSRLAELARSPHQGEFRTLSVSPQARRRGVARALVEACFERARSAGMTEMVLCSLTSMLPAHRLYASFGFVRRPDLDWSPMPGVELWAFSAPVA